GVQTCALPIWRTRLGRVLYTRVANIQRLFTPVPSRRECWRWHCNERVYGLERCASNRQPLAAARCTSRTMAFHGLRGERRERRQEPKKPQLCQGFLGRCTAGIQCGRQHGNGDRLQRISEKLKGIG